MHHIKQVDYHPYSSITDVIGAVKALLVVMDLPVALTCAVHALQNYWELHDKMVIAPYVAGSADVTKPLAHFKEPVLPMAERKWLLHFRGGCLPYGFMFPNQTKIVTGKVRARPLEHAGEVRWAVRASLRAHKCCRAAAALCCAAYILIVECNLHPSDAAHH